MNSFQFSRILVDLICYELKKTIITQKHIAIVTTTHLAIYHSINMLVQTTTSKISITQNLL